MPGVNFKRSRLGSYHFACLCFAPGGLLILWMVYRCDVSNWSTARTSLWLNRHTSKLIFCWEVLCRLPSAQIFVFLSITGNDDCRSYSSNWNLIVFRGLLHPRVFIFRKYTSHTRNLHPIASRKQIYSEKWLSLRHTHVWNLKEFNFSDFVNGVITKDSIGMRTETILAVLALAIGKLFFTCRKLIPWVIGENLLFDCYFSNSFAWKTSLAT